jgi:CheY-like chemotaxis protein
LGLMSIIVIVDDRVTNRNIFAKLAASIEPGVEVQSFGDPTEALAWLQNNTPDLIVTDYKVPNSSGASARWATARKSRSSSSPSTRREASG